MYYCSFCSEKLKRDSCKKRNLKKKSKRAKYLLYIHSPKYYIYIIFVKYTFTRCVCEVVHELTETPLFGASSRRGWSHGGTPPGRPLTPRPTGNSPSLYASPRPGNQPETQRGQTRHHVYKRRGQRGAPLDTDKQNQDRWRDTGSEVEDEVTVDDRYCVQPQRGAPCEDGF